MTIAVGALAHVVILLAEHVFTPSANLGHDLAVRAIRSGPYATLFWFGAIGLGGFAPILLVASAAGSAFAAELGIAAAVTALVGGFAWEYIWVEAGQSVPNS